MAFEIDVTTAQECGARLRQVRQQAADIGTLADNADPDLAQWGALGAGFAAAYWLLAPEVHAHLEQMVTALGSRITALEACVENYAAQDAAAAAALKKIDAQW